MASAEKTDITLKENENIGFISQIKYEHFIAGIAGGVVSTVILHPLDLLKIRFEVNNNLTYKLEYRGITNSLFTIFKQEGIKGLYRGAVPAIIGSGASWGFYFYFYTALKNVQQRGELNRPLSAAQHIAAASEAGIMTLLLTNPIWVSKTRLCLQRTNQKSDVDVYKNCRDALFKIYKKEGIAGWYRGFIPSAFGVSHGAIQFMVYEECKNTYNKQRKTAITTKLGVLEYFTFAAISKLVAVAVTYPYQVLRSRLQNQFYRYNGSFDCIKKTWRYEGWKGFYKGLGTNLVKVIPSTMITFVVYENVSHGLLSFRK